MINRTVLSWGKNRRQSGAGGYPSKTPSQSNGIRKHWRMFGMGARSILCICAENYTDADYHHTTTRADASCAPLGNCTPLAVSDDGQKSHPEQSAWFGKTVKRLRTRSEPGGDRERKRSGRADRGREGGQSDDDVLHHQMARLHLITPTKIAATGERIQATTSSFRDDTDTDVLMGANPREEEPGGVQAAGKLLQGGEGWLENQEESDPAWEALKRRVLYLEENGSSSLEMNKAERALRELRAQLRRGWAEEVMRTKEREECTRSTKKRRRNAGWWTYENGDLLRCTVTVSESLCEKEGSCSRCLSSAQMLSKATYIDQHSFGFFIALGNDTGLLFALLGAPVLAQGCAGQTISIRSDNKDFCT
jgi:hypothetical protein